MPDTWISILEYYTIFTQLFTYQVSYRHCNIWNICQETALSEELKKISIFFSITKCDICLFIHVPKIIQICWYLDPQYFLYYIYEHIWLLPFEKRVHKRSIMTRTHQSASLWKVNMWKVKYDSCILTKYSKEETMIQILCAYPLIPPPLPTIISLNMLGYIFLIQKCS